MLIQLNKKNTINFFIVIFLILFGVISRLMFEHSIGLQDAEWWRAWMFKLASSGPLQIYSEYECNNSLIEALKVVKELEAPFFQRGCQAVVEFAPNNYFRTQFPIVQPQLFYIHLWMVGMIGKQQL